MKYKKHSFLNKRIVIIFFSLIIEYLFKMLEAAYKYPDGSNYNGEWNKEGQRHGKYHLYIYRN